MTRSVSLRHSLLLGVVLAVAGCGSDSKPAAPAANAAAPPAASAAVQKIYASTCSNCHGKPASGAPQTGDAQAWAPRVAQGRDTVLGHVINGYKGMPPMGLCMQCSEDDFVAVTEYMAGAALK